MTDTGPTSDQASNNDNSEEEARLIRSAIQDFTSLFFLMRPDSSFMYVNDTTCSVLGYSKEELLTMRVPDVDPGYPIEHWDQLWEAIQKHEAVTIKSCLRTSSAEEVPVEIRLHRQEYNGKEFCTAFAEDITWRIESEEELRKARDAALEATRLKSEFLANMSHEIRTPMNGMLGMARLLMQTSLNTHQREFAQQIIESGEQLTEIIGEVLDFSKIESGKLELNEAPLDAIDLIEKVISLFANQVSTKVELSFVTPPHIPHCVGDPLRLRQVLSNLISNAIKFTPTGSINVSVEIIEATDNTIDLLFQVSDTGIGITRNAMQTIFQPFIQADGSVARKYGGTGLGLSISQQLLEMMESSLEVRSELGKGTDMFFRVNLNRLEPAVPEREPVQLRRIHKVILTECHSQVSQNLEQQLTYFSLPHQTICLGKFTEINVSAQQPLFLDTRQWLAHEQDWPKLASNWRVVLVTDGEILDEIPGRNYIERFVRKPITRNRLKQLLYEMDRGLDDYTTPIEDKPSLITNFDMSVLVVEDNKINYQLINYFFESMGCRATIATNGLIALEHLQKESFDAIFMDCHLPEMDGFTTTEKIRELEPEDVHVPIIAVSADATAETRKRCLDSGMDDYVSKPINNDTIYAMLTKWVLQENLPEKPETTLPAPVLHLEGMDMEVINTLREMEGSQGNLLETFTANLAKEVPISIKQLTDSIQLKSFAETAELAHQLKGSCGVVGALNAQKQCQNLREAAKKEDQPLCYSCLRELEKEAERMVEVLRNHVGVY